MTDQTPSASDALAEAYVASVDRVFELMTMLRRLDDEHGRLDEDIAWRVMANRLVYPAHFRLTKRDLAELLAAALSLLTSGPGVTPS